MCVSLLASPSVEASEFEQNSVVIVCAGSWRIAGIWWYCSDKFALSRTSLREEVRVLLVHGVLHLLGHDHELGEEQHQSMAGEEREILGALGWKVCLPTISHIFSCKHAWLP